MNPVLRQFRDFFVSLKLTVFLLALSIVLVFAATLHQVQLGIWGVLAKYFRSFIVILVIGHDVSAKFFIILVSSVGAVALLTRWLFNRYPTVRAALNGYVFAAYAAFTAAPVLLHIASQQPIPAPVFPGGYFIGGLLLINLIAAHVYRFRFEWKKAGVQLTHAGLILLLVGELITGLMQVESQMRIEEGHTSHHSESYRDVELALVDTTNPEYDEVVAIPQAVVADGGVIQHPKLPFQVRLHDYYPNAAIQMRDQVPNAPPAIATQGIGPRLSIIPTRVTYKESERNTPVTHVDIVTPEGTIGTWAVSPVLGMPQTFDYQGRTWQISLRFQRHYYPFAITLHDFRHDLYPGTNIPKNFSSRIQLKTDDGHDDREVLIYMNNPLRHAGLTFYQASFEEGDKVSIFQVVRNPGWLMPYAACVLMSLGLIVQFGMHLLGFIRKRRAA